MGIYATIANNNPALAALLRETAATTVTRKPGIDSSLVHDGLQFTTHGDRCRYMGIQERAKVALARTEQG